MTLFINQIKGEFHNERKVFMLDEDLTKLQVGDSVFVHYHPRVCIKPVQKITPTGLIKVDGNLFNANGFIRGGGTYCTTYIEIATPEKIEEFRQRVYIKRIINNLKNLTVEDITIEQAKEINRILEFEKSNLKKEYTCTWVKEGD